MRKVDLGSAPKALSVTLVQRLPRRHVIPAEPHKRDLRTLSMHGAPGYGKLSNDPTEITASIAPAVWSSERVADDRSTRPQGKDVVRCVRSG